MTISDKLTKAQRGTLSKAHNLLGDSLSAFLLSGLGDTSIKHRRAFTAQSTFGQGNEITYQFEMINDSAPGLPMGSDPLVMAHLLDLLHKGMRMDDCVDFNIDDILKTLGWSRTPESHLLIKQAIERYALTTYCLVNSVVADKESISCFQRLLIRYETVSNPVFKETSVGQLLMKVQFFPYFIYHIHAQRKTFLGIDFRQLEQMQEIPY
jgi:hypothetical protein